MAREQSDKQKREAKLKQYRRIFRFYVVPILAGIVFVGMLAFLIAPKVQSIFDTLDVLASEDEALEEQIGKVNDLKILSQKTNTLLAQLEVLNETAPSGTTEVVKFRDKVTALILQNGLEIKSQQLSETSIEPTDASGTQLVGGQIVLQEVPFSFEITGSYTNMLNFVNVLSNIEDFIVVREMELSSAQSTLELTQREWNLKLKIDKYQFKAGNQEELKRIFRSIPATAKVSEEIVQYINSRLKAS